MATVVCEQCGTTEDARKALSEVVAEVDGARNPDTGRVPAYLRGELMMRETLYRKRLDCPAGHERQDREKAEKAEARRLERERAREAEEKLERERARVAKRIEDTSRRLEAEKDAEREEIRRRSRSPRSTGDEQPEDDQKALAAAERVAADEDAEAKALRSRASREAARAPGTSSLESGPLSEPAERPVPEPPDEGVRPAVVEQLGESPMPAAELQRDPAARPIRKS